MQPNSSDPNSIPVTFLKDMLYHALGPKVERAYLRDLLKALSNLGQNPEALYREVVQQLPEPSKAPRWEEIHPS